MSYAVPPTPKPNFRLNARKYLFYYPKCDIKREDLLANVRSVFGSNVLWAIVSREGDNIYVGFELKKKTVIRWLHSMDCLAKQHVEYNTMKNRIQGITFLYSKDNDCLTYGIDIKEVLTASVKHKNVTALLWRNKE